jgi:hypothetical protein
MTADHTYGRPRLRLFPLALQPTGGQSITSDCMVIDTAGPFEGARRLGVQVTRPGSLKTLLKQGSSSTGWRCSAACERCARCSHDLSPLLVPQ